MSLTLKSQNRAFGGWVRRFTHESTSTKTTMTLSVFLPKEASAGKVPAIYYLSGLTCTDENFTTKAGAQRYAAEHGLALVAPDTSPRGAGVEGESTDWDFGVGAGFYVNATTPAWSKNYNMYDYVVKELPTLLESSLPLDPARKSVMGHSMGATERSLSRSRTRACSAAALRFRPSATR